MFYKVIKPIIIYNARKEVSIILYSDLVVTVRVLFGAIPDITVQTILSLLSYYFFYYKSVKRTWQMLCPFRYVFKKNISKNFQIYVDKSVCRCYTILTIKKQINQRKEMVKNEG